MYLTLAFLFIMFRDHLILPPPPPPVLPLRLALFSQRLFRKQGPSPHPTRWTWRSARLCFNVSQLPVVIVVEPGKKGKIKDGVKNNTRIPASTLKKNQLLLYMHSIAQFFMKTFFLSAIFFILPPGIHLNNFHIVCKREFLVSIYRWINRSTSSTGASCKW